MADGAYPIDIAVDYPAQSSRGWAIMTILSLKYWALIPHLIVLYALRIVSGLLFFIAQIIILFTGNYPESMARFVANYMAWELRVNCFLFGLTDKYPPFTFEEAAYPVRLSYEYPSQSSRVWAVLTMLFLRWLSLIPHAFALLFLFIGALVVFFLSQLIVLFTGKYPEGMHNYMVGVIRWATRVSGFAYALTDEYPPFSMS
jgi:hypothetical protein